MLLLCTYEHDFAAISPFLSERIGTLCRHPCSVLWLEQRTTGWRSGRSEGDSKSLSVGTPPQTSYSSRSEHPVWFPGDFTGPSHRAPSISFGAPSVDRMSITTSCSAWLGLFSRRCMRSMRSLPFYGPGCP